jgi:glyoxylase-like metal-dependent hydrolase (beta-lactamase superfamily II)
MKRGKTLAIIIGAVMAPLLVFAVLRYAALVADNRYADPEGMVESYTDSGGARYYRINSGINNAYLVPLADGWFLVDTGYPGDYGRFKKALGVIGIEPAFIRWLFITHAHDEHAGFAAALRRESGCRLIVPEASLEDLRAGRMVWKGRAINLRIAFVSSLYNFVKRRDLRFPPIVPGPGDLILKGDAVDISGSVGLRGTMMATPGHSPDSWSLLMSDGRAFCGDAAMNFLNLLGADYRPIFVTDEGQAYASLKKLLRAGAVTFFTGHGPAFDKGSVEALLERYYSGGE